MSETSEEELDKLIDKWLIEDQTTEATRLPVAVATGLRREVKHIFDAELVIFRTQMAAVMRQELECFRVKFEQQLTATMTNAAIQAARATRRLVAAEMRVAEATPLSHPEQSTESS